MPGEPAKLNPADLCDALILRDRLPSSKVPTSNRPFSSDVLGEPHSCLEHALTYADLGLRVFPVHSVSDDDRACGLPCCSCSEGFTCSSPGKHPHIAKWPNKATIDPRQIHHWWGHVDTDHQGFDPWAGGRWPDANIGIATGRGLAVVDVDPRNGGFETLAALEAELGPLPRDWVVETGGGGLHIYLRVPLNVGQLRHELGPGVELQHTGRFVVAPPSRHYSGGTYGWQSMDGDRHPRMSKAWLERAKIEADNVVKSSNCNELRNKQGTQTKSEIKPIRLHPVICPVPSRSNAPFDLAPADLPEDTKERMRYAALRTLATKPGACNRCLLELARSLRLIPGLAGLPHSYFRWVIDLWHALSSNTDEDRKAIQKHWKRAWKMVNGPGWDDSKNPAQAAYHESLSRPLPPAAARYEGNAELQQLVALCIELDRRSGLKLWYLSARKAADLLGVSKWKAHRYLGQLANDGVIEKAIEHVSHSPKAQRYRYLHVAPDQQHDGVIEKVPISRRRETRVLLPIGGSWGEL